MLSHFALNNGTDDVSFVDYYTLPQFSSNTVFDIFIKRKQSKLESDHKVNAITKSMIISEEKS